MRIAFTGHRDKAATPARLRELAGRYPNAVWVHGGARGFDSQVAETAAAYGIRQEVIEPDYSRHASRKAPLIRNLEIIENADMLVACYDGRKTGGTAFTVERARKKGVATVVWHPDISTR